MLSFSAIDIIVFVIADVVSLVVQSVGGAIAAGADDDRKQSDLGSNIMVGGIFFQLGKQKFFFCDAEFECSFHEFFSAGALVCLTLYSILAMEVFIRFHLQKPIPGRVPQQQISLDSEENVVPEKPLPIGGRGIMQGSGVMPPRIGLMVIGLVVATVLVFIRYVKLCVENHHNPIDQFHAGRFTAQSSFSEAGTEESSRRKSTSTFSMPPRSYLPCSLLTGFTLDTSSKARRRREGASAIPLTVGLFGLFNICRLASSWVPADKVPVSCKPFHTEMPFLNARVLEIYYSRATPRFK